MNTQKTLLVVLFSITALLLLCSLELKKEMSSNSFEKIDFGHGSNVDKPSSILMYENLEKYSDEYDIPKHIIYNIAFLETTYKGPFDWSYNPARTSPVGAVGPMQIMPATANGICDRKVSVNKLKTDIQFNIETSVKLLRKLYKKYGDWEVVCGCYNTGKPIINEYARFCEKNKDYQKNWRYISR